VDELFDPVVGLFDPVARLTGVVSFEQHFCLQQEPPLQSESRHPGL
jgi:hypothetical protein